MPLGNPIRKQNESRIISVLATEGQSVFTVEGGYTINQISVFRNGVRLSNAEDFTAGDGSTVTLNNEANVDDRIEFHIFDKFTVQNAIIGAASSQTINGDLVLTGKLFGTGDFSRITTGIVTATQLDLNGSLDVSSTSVFNDDVTFTGASENVTFDKSVDSLIFNDGAKAIFGTSSDMHITHNGTLSQIANGTNQLEIISNDLDLRSSTGDEHYFTAQVGGAATVFYDNSVRLETTPSGADVTGTLNVTGISTLQAITATTAAFSGEVSIAESLVHTGDSDTKLSFDTNTIKLSTNSSERLRIDSDGAILKGPTTGRAQFFHSVVSPRVQIEGADDFDRQVSITSSSSTASFGGTFILAHQRSGAIGGNTTLQAADLIGMLSYQGHDGTNFIEAARIHSVVESGVGANDMPADLRFSTNSGTTSITERMRITSTGSVGIGTNNPTVGNTAYPVVQVHSTSSNAYFKLTNTTTGVGAAGVELSLSGSDAFLTNREPAAIIFRTGGSNERMRITQDGEILIGTTTDANVKLDVGGSLRAKSAGYVAPASGTGLEIYYATNTLNDAPSGYLLSYDRDSGAYKKINYDASEHKFRTSGTERLSIDSAGRVLINTTNTSNGHISSSNLAVQGADLAIFKDSGGDNVGVSGHKLKFVTQSGSLGEIDVLSEGGGGPSGRGGAMRFYTKANNTASASERLRITSDGLIGINNSSPNLGGGGDGIHIASSGVAELHLTGSQGSAATDGLQIQMNGNIANIINRETGSIKFYIGGASSGNEKLRIDSSGRVLIGADEQGGTLSGLEYRSKISSESGQTYALVLGERGGQGMLIACRLDGAGSNTVAVRFADGPGASSTAAITVSNTTVTYGTGSSDRTMKKNFENWTETVLTKFKNLNPQKFNYKVEEDGTEKTKGYIAQDLVDSFPEAYPKDPETDKYSFNPSGMVVYLMKALQEATTKIETLEAKVTALEGS